ncbi:protein numb homolog isoform X1 [Styela clava]
MMRSIRNSFRRKKKPKVPESTQPPEWQQDEKSVQTGTCKFHVKYLGCIEVQDSRGMQVCEQAVKSLKADLRKHRTARMFGRGKKKKIKAILYVSPEALRVVEDSSKALLLDQTIEKVSFCAPDRNYNHAFSYICRDGTTRRWICHSFFAIKDSGERLSHAVGCAFAACLEKKQKRERETIGVTARYDNNRTMFTREGSFRPKMQTDIDQENKTLAIIKSTTEVPADVHTSAAVPRPHAPLHLVRQASLRNFSNKKKFMDGDLNSPFKRNLSLRVNELPSTINRQQVMNPVPEVETEMDIEAHLPHANTFSNGDDPFTKAPPMSKPAVRPTNLNGFGEHPTTNGGLFTSGINNDLKAMNMTTTTQSPVRETNPWASEVTQQQQNVAHKRTPSQADQWLSGLESQAKNQQPFITPQPMYNPMMMQQQPSVFQPQPFQQPMTVGTGYTQFSTQQQTFTMPTVQPMYQQQNAFMVNM